MLHRMYQSGIVFFEKQKLSIRQRARCLVVNLIEQNVFGKKIEQESSHLQC